MNKKMIIVATTAALTISMLSGCGKLPEKVENDKDVIVTASTTNTDSEVDASLAVSSIVTNVSTVSTSEIPVEEQIITTEEVSLTDDMVNADHSEIHTGTAILYKNNTAGNKGITVCVNAGHGTSGGSGVQTLCHPDGSPKVTGGSTSAGATYAAAVSGGTTFLDGTPESSVTLQTAIFLKDMLLEEGYSVLMIRETEDVQLDNVARTVLANNYADCHIALHWDSSESDKGAFYIKVPSIDSYKSMEPVASTWEKSDALGEQLVAGLGEAGRTIFSSGYMEIDLTQISYSSIPSVDIELGDRASDHSDATLQQIAQGLLFGINHYYEQGAEQGMEQSLDQNSVQGADLPADQ